MAKYYLKQKQNKAVTKQMPQAFNLFEPSGLEHLGLVVDNTLNCYLPPYNRAILAKLPYHNAQHCGILQSRANIVSAGFVGDFVDMKTLCLNLIQFGDVALLKIRNVFGEVIRLHVLSSLYLRVKQDGNYLYLLRKSLYNDTAQYYHYDKNDIIFLKLYDPLQQTYGAPDYVGGIESALLNSDATIFRRRYYSNGAHMGFILYTTDPDLDQDAEDAIRKKIEQSKGVGNFKSMFINIPNGNPDGVKLISVGDTGRKDEFDRIKNISAQDVLTTHRFPPGLSGIIPSNTGGLGDPLKILAAYRETEAYPLQDFIAAQINKDPEISNKNKILFKRDKQIKAK